MSEELLPYPFCGSEAYFIEQDCGDYPCRNGEKWDIGCETEGCIVWDGLGYFQTKEWLTKVWNRRALRVMDRAVAI